MKRHPVKKTYITVLTWFFILQGVSLAWVECCCGYTGIPIEGGFPETCTCLSVSDQENSARKIETIDLDDCSCRIHLIDSDPPLVIVRQPFDVKNPFHMRGYLPAAVSAETDTPMRSEERTSYRWEPIFRDTILSQAYLCVFLC
jgi:hypothetical protein